MDRGITLAGGGALLQGLEQRLRDECQMPCQLAESPLTCVAVGSGISLEEFETIHRASKNSGRGAMPSRPDQAQNLGPNVYRKQVRRRRAVLALLVISSFVLLTITYGQESGGLQRGVSTIFSPLQDGRRPRPEAGPRPGQLVRQDLRRARRKQPPQGRTGRGPRAGGRRPGGAAGERAAAQAARARPRPGDRRSGYDAGDRPGDRPLADRLALDRDDRRRQRRRRPASTTR